MRKVIVNVMTGRCVNVSRVIVSNVLVMPVNVLLPMIWVIPVPVIVQLVRHHRVVGRLLDRIGVLHNRVSRDHLLVVL